MYPSETSEKGQIINSILKNKEVHLMTMKKVTLSIQDYKNRLASIILKNPYVEDQIDIDFSGLRRVNPWFELEEDNDVL